MTLQNLNRFRVLLGGAINDIVTTIPLAAGAGALLPVISAANPMRFVITDGTNFEVIEATGKSGDDLTGCTRAAEPDNGGAAKSWATPASTYVSSEPTAGTIAAKADSSDLSDHLSDATDAHDASAISNVPAGNIVATDVQAAINELDTEKATTGSVSAVASDLADHIADATDAHDASAISNVAAGSIVATTVQAAIDELDTEKIAKAEFTAVGDILVGTGAGTSAKRKNNDAAAVAPAVTDDSASGYAIGSRWLDTTADKEYVALDVSVGAAVWAETTALTAPGGADSQVQYNNGGVFGGASAMTYDDATGNVAFDTNTLFVDAANNRVGVGTAAPTRPHHVELNQNGTTFALVKNTTNASAADARFEADSASFRGFFGAACGAYTANTLLTTRAFAISSADTFGFVIGCHRSAQPIVFGIATVDGTLATADERMRLTTTGLGIGGTPTEKLDVVGNAKVSGSITVGAGTPITKMVVYTPTLSPVEVAASTSAEQTFTVAGLTTADKIIVNKPTNNAGLGIVNARVSAADTLALTFGNFTAGALTPTASEVYNIIAVRS